MGPCGATEIGNLKFELFEFAIEISNVPFSPIPPHAMAPSHAFLDSLCLALYIELRSRFAGPPMHLQASSWHATCESAAQFLTAAER